MNPIDMIMDENNNENIIMYNEQNEPVEFAQIAVIPLNEQVYVILKPVGDVEGIGEDEALVFSIEEYEDEEALSLVDDDQTIDQVFEEYYQMLREAGIEI